MIGHFTFNLAKEKEIFHPRVTQINTDFDNLFLDIRTKEHKGSALKIISVAY